MLFFFSFSLLLMFGYSNGLLQATSCGCWTCFSDFCPELYNSHPAGADGSDQSQGSLRGEGEEHHSPDVTAVLCSMASMSSDGEGLCACTSRLLSAHGVVAASALVKSQCERPVLLEPSVGRLLSLQIENTTELFVVVVQRHKMPQYF